jgi:hypothetical protein
VWPVFLDDLGGNVLLNLAAGAQEVLGQSVQDVNTVHAVLLNYGQVHGNHFEPIGLGNAERLLEHLDKVAQLLVLDELGAVGVEFLPL